MVERRLTGMITAAAVLILLFVFWDAFRPTARVVPDATSHEPLRIAEPPPIPPPNPAVQTAPTATTTSQGGDVPPPPVGPDGRELTYIDLLARSETRRRIRASGNSTYLSEMLEASGDSMLRRWENRTTAPVRVWFAPTHAANFQPAFLDQIRSSFATWTNAGVPVRFDFTTDSSDAEVVVKWRIQFEIQRTGQTDVTWDQDGRIQSAVITLATFDPDGRPMTPEDVRIVATHEIGHALGLDHSKDSTDMMFPMTRVRDLSDRDVRTVLLLYQLTPGSLR
jgi:predicted Zn-dependent protease